MNEHGFIKSVHRSLPTSLYAWKINDKFAGGVPDAFYAGPAGNLFVEYKFMKSLPKRDNTELRLGLSPQQVLWLNKYHDMNHKVAVIVGCENTALILTNKSWTKPLTRSYYLSNCVPRKEVAGWISKVCEQDSSNEHKQQAGGRCG